MGARFVSSLILGGVVTLLVVGLLALTGERDRSVVLGSAAFWGLLSFIWSLSKSGQRGVVSQAMADGQEHLRLYPLICQKGEDAQALAKAGRVQQAKDELLSIMHFLAVRGIIDQFLLAKCFLGLLACECKLGGEAGALLEGRLPGELATALGKPTLKAMEVRLLSAQDQRLFDSASEQIRNGQKPDLISQLSPWDFGQLGQDSLSIIKIYPSGSIVCICNLKRSSPPKLQPGMEKVALDFSITKK